MKVDTTTLVPVSSVVASVLLLLAGKTRIFELIALIASAAWLLVTLDVFDWPLKHRYLGMDMVIGGVLLICGIAVYLKTENKREVTASTVISILGGVLLLAALARLT
jgi:hypothetical protein